MSVDEGEGVAGEVVVVGGRNRGCVLAAIILLPSYFLSHLASRSGRSYVSFLSARITPIAVLAIDVIGGDGRSSWCR